jgi:hypothetical protein
MQLSQRDRDLLLFLYRTPATAAQILKASVAFDEGEYRDERRVRERLQALAKQKLVRSFPLAISGGGLANYYRLTPEGYRVVKGEESELPHRSQFAELPPSRLMHSLQLADVIAHVHSLAHRQRVRLTSFHRENELILEVGNHRVVPDCHLQLETSGRTFNLLVELDRSNESLDGIAATTIRTKLLGYEAYQDYVLGIWKNNGEQGARPAFRVVFLTMSAERALHILALARDCARNRDRRLCYAATIDGFLSDPQGLRTPIFLDHGGRWNTLVNPFPTATFQRAPVRIPPFVQPSLL